MGQEDILDFLKNNPGKKFTSTELSKAVNISSINIPLKKMRNDNIINWEEKTGNTLYFLYWHKEDKENE